MQLDEWLDVKAEGIARHIQADSAVYLWQMAAICVAITLICITAPVRTGSLTEIISLWSEMLPPMASLLYGGCEMRKRESSCYNLTIAKTR